MTVFGAILFANAASAAGPAPTATPAPAATPTATATVTATPAPASPSIFNPAAPVEDYTSGSDVLRFGSLASLVEVHGLMDFEYRQDEENPGTFDVHHVYLFFQTEPVKGLHARAQLEIEHGGIGAGANGKVVTDVAEISYQLVPALTLAVGRDLVPVGYEIFDHYAPRNRLITRPLASQVLLSDEWVDVGVSARGVIKVSGPFSINYDMRAIGGLKGVTGSEDIDLQTEDNNKDKTLIGSLYLHCSGATLGGSGSYGKWDPQGKLAYYHVVGSAVYQRENLDVRGEWITRTSENSAVPGGPKTTFHDRGAYAQAYYAVATHMKGLYSIGPAVRYDYVDLQQPVVGVTRQVAGGLLYRPFEWLRVKAEYRRDITAKPEFNGFDAQVTADF